jgi:signal transduction histidine kinase
MIVSTLLLSSIVLTVPAGQSTDVRSSEAYITISEARSQLQHGEAHVTVRATLTRNGDPLYIADSTGAAVVEDPHPTEHLKIGDQLLVSGWVEETASGLLFHKPEVRVLWPGTPTPPLAVTADQAALGKFADSLIEVRGRLLEIREEAQSNSLKIASGNQIFLARFDAAKGSLLLPHLERGSILRLRGICSIRPDDTHYLGGFALLLRSAEDVDVVSGAPWSSPWHLFELGMGLLVFIFAGHAARVKVMQTRFRAITTERARVAHEMHDTLAQGFAGLAFQIQAARSSSSQGDAILHHHLDLALEMVRHSHSEAHRSIVTLRPQSLDDTTSLRDALKQSIERMVEGCSIDMTLRVNGDEFRLPLFMEDALYRVGQESVANALRHAKPGHLALELEYACNYVAVTVSDDGCGFDPPHAAPLGFGISGMRQRIRALHGTLSIWSRPGEGTRVRAEVPRPSPASMRIKSTFNAYRKYWRLLGN